jgi:hypothetical protein
MALCFTGFNKGSTFNVQHLTLVTHCHISIFLHPTALLVTVQVSVILKQVILPLTEFCKPFQSISHVAYHGTLISQAWKDARHRWHCQFSPYFTCVKVLRDLKMCDEHLVWVLWVQGTG